jgi:hypothetical protein
MALPVLKYLLVSTSAGQSIDLGVQCGTVYLINKGADPVFIAFDAVIASAAYGNGKKELKANESLQVSNVSVSTVYARTASGTANLEVVGTVSS